MKKHRLYVILLCMMCFGSAIRAELISYVGGYAGVGEWSLLPVQSNYTASFGGAADLGFVYELRAGKKFSQTHFILNIGAGLNGGSTTFGQSTNALLPLYNQIDLDNDPFDYYYELSGRRDSYDNIALRIPVMIGVQHRRFYMLAGIKIGANVWTQARTNATLDTYGDYGEYIGQFRNMPELQYFSARPLKAAVKSAFNLDMDVCLEIGGRIGADPDAVGFDVPKRKIEYRLAAFVDYGLTDLHKSGRKDAFEAPKEYNKGKTYPAYNTTSMVDHLVINDIMSTTNFAKAVNNLIVGLKFTVLFRLPKHGKCVMCDYSPAPSVARSGGRRGMKYEE